MRTEAAAKRPFGVDVSSFAAVASQGGKSGSAAFRPSDRNPGSRLILNRAGKLSNLRSAVEPPAGFCNVAFGKTAFKRIEVKLGETRTIELGVSESDSTVFFYGPSEVVQKAVSPGARLRVGGLVKTGSVVKSADQTVVFVVTDGANDLKVAYQGLLPDLFREGQGVVAEGVLAAAGQMRAETILAKHDERYMPREVVGALKKQGRWQEGTTATQ